MSILMPLKTLLLSKTSPSTFFELRFWSPSLGVRSSSWLCSAVCSPACTRGNAAWDTKRGIRDVSLCCWPGDDWAKKPSKFSSTTITCWLVLCHPALELRSGNSAIHRCTPFSWSIGRSNGKLMRTGALGEGSNARSLESSVWMSSRRNWDWAKKISLSRQRAVLLTYFAVKAHSEELAVIWRSPENSSISTMLIKTLGSCKDYNNQTYRQVTNNRTWYHYKEGAVPSVGQGVRANCTGCSQWHVQGWCIKGGGGRHTVDASQKNSSS